MKNFTQYLADKLSLFIETGSFKSIPPNISKIESTPEQTDTKANSLTGYEPAYEFSRSKPAILNTKYNNSWMDDFITKNLINTKVLSLKKWKALENENYYIKVYNSKKKIIHNQRAYIKFEASHHPEKKLFFLFKPFTLDTIKFPDIKTIRIFQNKSNRQVLEIQLDPEQVRIQNESDHTLKINFN